MDRAETPIGFLESARRSPKGDVLDEAGWKALEDDARALGLFGLLGSLAFETPPEIDPEVRAELVEPLTRDLRDALPDAGERDLPALLDHYRAAKGARGGDLLSRLVARVIYEVFDLRTHQFVQDDTLMACEALGFGRADQDARELARRVSRLSRVATRYTLGHLDSQLEFVHELGNTDFPVDYRQVDLRMFEFAPKIYAPRLPSLVRALMNEEKRFRFVFVLWARLRGVISPRQGLVDGALRIEPKEPMLLIQALVERAEVRARLREATASWPLADQLEQVFLARTLARPD